jgi:xanthine dehydrogenase accessory factor
VAFVASQKKWDAVRKVLAERGVPADRLARVHAPAGVDISAVEPEEIALSVMAQIVQARRTALGEGARTGTAGHAAPAPQAGPKSAAPAAAKSKPAATPAEGKAIDPICKMQVDIKAARHTAQHEGRTFYFCCAGCKQRFEQNPSAYI